MQTAKEKLSSIASAAKKHVMICKAKTEEKVEKASARTKEEKEIAHERRKAKEAKAKMELHQAKAEHKAERLNNGKHSHIYGHHDPVVGTHGHHQPVIGTHAHHGHHHVGTAAPTTGVTAPAYPVVGHPHV